MAKRPAKKNSHKPKPWFIKVRGSYLPNSWQGWLTYIPYTAYLIIAFFVVVEDYHSLLGKAFSLVVYSIVGVGLMTWIAMRES